MKTAKFTKRIENFKCEHCSVLVNGFGYTNHCPQCLWSKHVDVNPGDRLSGCLGMMEPIGLKKKGKEFSLVLRCLVCGLVKPNKVSPEDCEDKIRALGLMVPNKPIKSSK